MVLSLGLDPVAAKCSFKRTQCTVTPLLEHVVVLIGDG